MCSVTPMEKRLAFDLRIGQSLCYKAAGILEKLICDEIVKCEHCMNLEKLVNQLKDFAQDSTRNPMDYPNETPVLPGI